MSKVFIVADLHLGHEKLAAVRGFSSAQEHDDILVTNWNSVVGRKDSTWVLGDVAFSKTGLTRLAEMNGYKKLVLGNHDRYSMEEYSKYFTKIFGAIRYKECILTHIPVHEGQFGRYTRNIHGHLHGNAIRDSRYVCVSVERTGLKPVEWDSLGE